MLQELGVFTHMKKVKVIWRRIEVNHLVESLAAHAHACNAIERAWLNANRGVLKRFPQGLDAEEPAAEEPWQNQEKSSISCGRVEFCSQVGRSLSG
jgi:hypothetical protein